ncbi:MAG: protease modulator HflC [Clostridia bacterium]|nr:protease modulator HflC [Clostridia bacterium]
MKIAIKISLGVLLVVVIIALMSSFYTVEENEFACVKRFSKIIDTTDEPGLHLMIPFVDSVDKFPKGIMIYDISPSEVLTSDKQSMTVDSYVLWRIQDPLLFYQSLGSSLVAEQKLDALTYNALKNVMGTLAQSDIINQDDPTERNDIYEGITQNVSELAVSYGIEVVDVKIKRLDLPEANEQAVYSRMISERMQIAEKYMADGEYEASIIRNQVDKEVNIMISNAEVQAELLVAEGEAEYMRILAEAYNSDSRREFYEFILALDALKASLNGDENMVVLDADSPLGRILLNP